MTSRERMLTAMRHGQADCVPVCPDISNMIPCKLQNRPFWEIYIHQNPPLWKAYVEAVTYFGIDAWYDEGSLQFISKERTTPERVYLARQGDRYVERKLYRTPAGNMRETTIFPMYDSPTKVEKVVKDFKEDFEKYMYFYPEIQDYDDEIFKIQKEELGERGVIGIYAGDPGIATMISFFDGNLEAAIYAYHDYPDEFSQVVERQHKWCLRKAEMAIDAGVDFVEVGGSGDLTLQTPAMWREIVLPTIREITRMCKQAGVISGLHTCGKQRYIAEVCAEETDLDYINPLEGPPMGDCNLGELKRKYGEKLCLMGNLHTTDVMLRGTPEGVERASIEAIDDAGKGGGFILSTGDQCGRDTPEENLFRMVEVARTYGKY
ncbi:MAG: uroporphyrinogen decarboxylase family protein [Candidatus Latescibacterota bacterium]